MMRRRVLILGALALLAVAAHPGVAAADRPFTIGAQPAWFLLGGVTGGATLFDTRGGFVGGELSVVRLRQGRFAGVYADAYRDFGLDGTYVTAGLEAGSKHLLGLGVDAGAALRWADGGRDLGATGRVFASVTIFSVYARYAYFDTDANGHVLQVGATLKVPLVSPW